MKLTIIVILLAMLTLCSAGNTIVTRNGNDIIYDRYDSDIYTSTNVSHVYKFLHEHFYRHCEILYKVFTLGTKSIMFALLSINILIVNVFIIIIKSFELILQSFGNMASFVFHHVLGTNYESISRK